MRRLNTSFAYFCLNSSMELGVKSQDPIKSRPMVSFLLMIFLRQGLGAQVGLSTLDPHVSVF